MSIPVAVQNMIDNVRDPKTNPNTRANIIGVLTDIVRACSETIKDHASSNVFTASMRLRK